MLHTRPASPLQGVPGEKVARLYELHVFPFGSRLYAHTIAGGGSWVLCALVCSRPACGFGSLFLNGGSCADRGGDRRLCLGLARG